MAPTRSLAFALAVLAFAIAASACSREVEPFSANERNAGIGTSPNQLTFSPADDRSPSWSTAGDSVFYTTRGGSHLPPDSGVLVGLPVDGGSSAPILPNAQLEGDAVQNWLVAPAPAPDGRLLTFVEIVSTWAPHPCDPNLADLQCTPNVPAETVRRPELRQIAIHLRGSDDTAPLSEDEQLPIDVPGVTEELIPGPFATLATTVHTYPFHQLFGSERALFMRSSWSPDGDRIAFSDGLALYVWTTGEAEAEMIPGTENGAWPAWSPDGEWIAYTRLTVVDSSNVSCDYISDFGTTACTQERTDFVPGPRILTLTRPDGSESMELGEGDEPAWTPDGSTLFFRRGAEIWRIEPNGSSASPVPDTENGREPAVSPDGGSLAFARLSSRGDYDIWILPLGT